ncbi:MAG: MarR family transcriptional regulator [Micrococcales bacterium 70-64]|nr:MarR family transcriptional regulator [Leifsonia sp.]ODU63866.1 MAG: MarR family transcriptional regulator [Leifsonia sp. SCN 70-46]OJX85557.1 MAG: MarR family transcriptional regulator [Micrococcales bacterium 70-64]
METWPTGRLLSTAARLVEHAWLEALEARGLTHAGMIALHFLDAGPLTQSDLARMAKVENQTMSRTVERLERSGFVERRADDADRRRQIVTRTPAGDAAWASTRSLESEVFPALDDSERMRAGLLEIIRRSSERRWK